MRLRAHAGVAKEPVAKSATREPKIAVIGIGYKLVFGSLFAVMVLVWAAAVLFRMGAWALLLFLLWPAFVAAARACVEGNPNRPREYWIAARVGSLLAERRARGGEWVDPAAHRPEARP